MFFIITDVASFDVLYDTLYEIKQTIVVCESPINPTSNGCCQNQADIVKYEPGILVCRSYFVPYSWTLFKEI